MIREATLEDLPLMEDAAKEFYASSKFLVGFNIKKFCEFWEGLLTTKIGIIYLLIEDRKVRGAIGGIAYPEIYCEGTTATEFFWFVEPYYRGVGLELYKRFERWAKDNGCKQIRMVHLKDLMPEKVGAIYKRLGFTPIEVHYAKEL